MNTAKTKTTDYIASFSSWNRLFSNNDDGTLSDVTYGFGDKSSFFKAKYDYNAEKALSLITYSLSSWHTGAKKSTMSYGYTYDDNGRIKIESFTETSKDENGATVESTEATNYTYDENNQLSTSENNTSKWQYSYDNRGNILSKKEYTVSVDENDEKVYTEKTSDSYTYDNEWKDKLTSFNGQTITYDASGNPTNYLGHNLSWTMGRQLASYDDITYTYNEDGLRTSKTVNGKTIKYYYDGTRLIQQYDGDNTLHFTYDRDGEVIGFTHFCLTTGKDDPVMTEYFYLKNAQGDIVGITNILGDIKARYTYDPWGRVISIEKNLDKYDRDIVEMNPLLYRGYVYDRETSLYYLQSRYYDPIVGRFINCDNVNYIGISESERSYNPFAYCENDSVNYGDESGQSIVLAMAIGFGVGVLISGCSKLYQNYRLGNRWYNGLAISMLAGGIGGAISCVTIPGVSSWVCATVFGATGNVVTKVILVEIKSISSLKSAVLQGAASGLLGNAAAKCLNKIVAAKFATWSKSTQKSFLSKIGRITNRTLKDIRQMIKNSGSTKVIEKSIYKVIDKYGYAALVSAFVSSAFTSI